MRGGGQKVTFTKMARDVGGKGKNLLSQVVTLPAALLRIYRSFAVSVNAFSNLPPYDGLPAFGRTSPEALLELSKLSLN